MKNKILLSLLIFFGSMCIAQANCDNRLHNAIEFALESGSIDTIALLIKEGANINQIDDEGFTPIQLVCFDAVERLYELTVLNTFCPSHASDDEEGYEEAVELTDHITLCINIMKILIAHGADISIKNDDDETVLEYMDNAIQEVDEALEDYDLDGIYSITLFGFTVDLFNKRDAYNALIILKNELITIKAILQS